MAQCHSEAVVSHTSAAVLHELPVWREHLDRGKRREDKLRALGWTVIRWMWHDIINPDADRLAAPGLRPRPPPRMRQICTLRFHPHCLRRVQIEAEGADPVNHVTAAGLPRSGWTGRRSKVDWPS